ncbi:YlbF family regulator [Thermodesulfitimonas autotrophica]|uniref:Cell fate (Sporulation/competence/biofilm development) regulator YlbF (YheA/YmcA/DUF963 family) n=1 Tax=Thermodesulfitimonas autotrophica TaxID=1894989 RepID=A0A3N5BAF4_9THEO|nr:YlbF family regulator [Thermodesulfitimonas autotrophica]RPF42665.1 cell fate (sporulation/competence/biofilm development) regulator YlbF (YheA/YmcA/DUF963 family) [Thermodesulfitimonas autotrophica]
MSVLVKALELGTALSQCEELRNLREAEQAMFADSEARALIEEFHQCRQELEFARVRGMQPGPELQQAIGSVQARMGANPLVRRFFEAQEQFSRILQEINQILNHAISGQGGCEPGGCSACGGGCGGECDED